MTNPRPDAPALQEIRAALDRAPASIVDRPVAHALEIYAATEGLRVPGSRLLFADVPLTALVALGHKNFAPAADTWRTLLGGLHGAGWRLDTLAHFESALGDDPLPGVEDSAGPLCLTAYGGAVICTSGIHRLVAAVCWLASRDGRAPVLKKARVRYQPINSLAVALIAEGIGRGAPISVAKAVESPGVRIRIGSGPDTRDWLAIGNRVSPAPSASLRGGLRSTDPRALGPAWRPLTPTCAAALADDGWLHDQLECPHYPNQPA